MSFDDDLPARSAVQVEASQEARYLQLAGIERGKAERAAAAFLSWLRGDMSLLQAALPETWRTWIEARAAAAESFRELDGKLRALYALAYERSFVCRVYPAWHWMFSTLYYAPEPQQCRAAIWGEQVPESESATGILWDDAELPEHVGKLLWSSVHREAEAEEQEHNMQLDDGMLGDFLRQSHGDAIKTNAYSTRKPPTVTQRGFKHLVKQGCLMFYELGVRCDDLDYETAFVPWSTAIAALLATLGGLAGIVSIGSSAASSVCSALPPHMSIHHMRLTQPEAEKSTEYLCKFKSSGLFHVVNDWLRQRGKAILMF